MAAWTPEELRAIAGAHATEVWIGTVRSALRHAADLTDAAHAVRDENERLRAERDALRKGERAEAPEPVGWMRPDELQQAAVAPRLCRMHPEKCKQSDMVPVYLHPPAAQPAAWPSRADDEMLRAMMAWRECDEREGLSGDAAMFDRIYHALYSHMRDRAAPQPAAA